MLTKIKNFLNERWEQISYKSIERFYLIIGILSVVSFYVGVFCKTCITWKIVIVVFIGFCMIMFYLYFLFYDEINKKESIYKEKVKEKVKNMLQFDETIEVCPRIFHSRNKNSLTQIFIKLKKELKGSDCRMDAYLEKDGTITLLFCVDNALDDIFKYTDYELFIKEWKIK